MKTYGLEDLKRMSPDRRLTLYQNAHRLRESGGQAIIDLINASGLPLRSGGLRESDPFYLEMEEVIWSPAGRAAAVMAAERGQPALVGVEPMLQARFGDRYSGHDLGTVNAGYIVGQLMRRLGYKDFGQAKCPDWCVARTAMRWVPAVKGTVGRASKAE